MQHRFTPVRTGRRRCGCLLTACSLRFTPVRTGRRCDSSTAIQQYAVHPRTHGEEARLRHRRARRRPVHPRTHGEDARTTSTTTRPWSVHPRTHGEDAVWRVRLDEFVRFTPVRTGRTPPSDDRRDPSAVHPRTHGEDDADDEVTLFDLGGSPPYARGGRPWVVVGQDHLRFTPVRTGRTSRSTAMPTTSPVHPRTHGEDAVGDLQRGRLRRFTPVRTGRTCVHSADRWAMSGSPPYARGGRLSALSCVDVFRFTPVRTGRTCDDLTTHEHRRRFTPVRTGRTDVVCANVCRIVGSPPYARGGLGRYAAVFMLFPVHPRTHGEDGITTAPGREYSGSPPYARGGLLVIGAGIAWRRFTPVRTGRTGSSQAPHVGQAVHPRTHGEDDSPRVSSPTGDRFTPVRTGRTTVALNSSPRRVGSPPYARGGRPRASARRRSARFTPVRTGRTGQHRPPGFFLSRFTPVRTGRTLGI